MKKRSLAIVLICVLLAACLFAGCGDDDKDPTKAPEVTATADASGATADPDNPDVTPDPDNPDVTSEPGSEATDNVSAATLDPNIPSIVITPAPEDITSGLKLKESISGDTFKFTPLEVKKVKTADDMSAGSGNVFLAIKVKAENISKNKEKFSSISLVKAYVKGKEVFDFAYLTDEYVSIDEVEINPGKTAEGYILFEVAENGGKVKLTYNEAQFDGNNCGVYELSY